MAETTRQVLRMAGVNPSRFSLEWASAAEGPQFVQLITGCVKEIRELGPLGEGTDEAGAAEVARRLDAAVKAASATKIRTAYGTLARSLHKSGDYSPEAIAEGVGKKLVPAFEKQLGL